MTHSVSQVVQPSSRQTSKTPNPNVTQHYHTIRQVSESLCQPLAVEDHVIQSMPDVSPPKWHLAHTTWFFETFILIPYLPNYTCFNPNFNFLFNSYYESVGSRHPRPQRGLLSRPTVAEIYQYRAYVDQAMMVLLEREDLADLIILGLHHEQQHQELLVTDIKHILCSQPVFPAYHADTEGAEKSSSSLPRPPLAYLDYSGGLYTLGSPQPGCDQAQCAFVFDNETPQHQVHLMDFTLASRLVTNGDYLEFIQDQGYAKPDLWLSDGWHAVQTLSWRAPLYWHWLDDQWWVATLSGLKPLNLNEPVCHVSYFEADAFARWSGKRLPTESEWEVAAANVPLKGHFLESHRLHPRPAAGTTRPDQIFGDVWEWTQSAYLPYPGYQSWPGAVGEYNGKFMCNQMVLRGGSCATPQHHLRLTYRNFFPPASRWQFSGIRLGASYDPNFS